MKKTTLQKIGLMALVASLALNAQAGEPTDSSGQQDKHNAATTASASRTTNHIVLAQSAAASKIASVPADAFWYNGDFNDINGLSNEDSTLAPGPVGAVYDDFNVPAGPGWDVTMVFSNDLISTTVTGATWEIRQGIVSGSAGTLIASGTTMTPSVTPTGRSGFGFTEFMVLVQGLTVHLDPGTYFLNVTPIGNNDGVNRSFNSTTSGANCVGTPCGNNDNSFFNGPFFGVFFGPASDQLGGPSDFSMGVSGGAATPTPTPSPTPTPNGDALWYNGDFNGVNGLANEDNDSLGAGQYARTYDDFNVTASNGWDVGSVFSNNLENLINVTGATWEIRQGISEGNGGTVIASGMTVTPTVTPTGRSGFGFTEYQVLVDGLTVHLPLGTYFLNVTPIGDGVDGRSFVSTTSGANCVGTPCGNDQNAFFDSNFFGATFTSTANESQPYDFSMGVNAPAMGGGLTLDSAFSEKTSRSGSFDIPLPLSGTPGVEDRQGDDAIYLVFNNNVTAVGGATSSCGNVRVAIDPDDSHQVIVTVASSRCDVQTITVTATDVTDDQGNTLASASVSYGKLVGDTSGNGVVGKEDVGPVRRNLGRTNSTNFRGDVNNDGNVNKLDLYVVKSKSGDTL